MCMFRICIWLAKEHHISNSNKKTFHGPGYRLVNAVKLSLQSGRNTQLRICIILVIFSCFRNTTDAIVSNYKKTTNIYDIVIFKALSFQNTLIRNYYDLLFFLVPRQASQKNLLVWRVLCTSRAWQFHSPAY